MPSDFQGTDLILVCLNDWSNVGYILQRSLQSVGVDALALKRKSHGFNYPRQADLVPRPVLDSYVERTKSVIFMHSQFIDVPLRQGQTISVFHGGTKYRKHPKAINRRFNPLVSATFIQTVDLLNLGAKNEVWLIPGVDYDSLPEPQRYKSGSRTFAHYPRGDYKGTEGMLKAVSEAEEEITFEFDHSKEFLSWPDHLSRMNRCDVYIDCLEPCGEWGMTALEAASLGKVVITNFGGNSLYQETYGSHELLVANTPEEITERIFEVLSWSDSEVRSKQQATLEWARGTHSYEATGRRIADALRL